MGGQDIAVVDDSQAGQGTHLLGEWYGCDFSKVEATDAVALRTLCLALTKEAGLEALADAFHQFEPQGVTGTVLLAESHLSIHTWPEADFVTIDVYVCNYLDDNTTKAQSLYSALKNHFQPNRECLSRVARGSK